MIDNSDSCAVGTEGNTVIIRSKGSCELLQSILHTVIINYGNIDTLDGAGRVVKYQCLPDLNKVLSNWGGMKVECKNQSQQGQ